MEPDVEDDLLDHSPDGGGAWPEAVLLRSDCILPTYYPVEVYRPVWPSDVASTLANVSTLLVYVLPGLVAVCTVGNLVLALVIRRLYPGVLSTALYVFVALVVDTFVVWTRCGFEWMNAAVNRNVRESLLSSSAIICKLYPFLSQFALQLSSWMTVAMAAETALVYQRPQALMRVCRLRRARIVVMATAVGLAVVSSASFYSHALVPPPQAAPGTRPLPSLCTNWVTEQRAPWKAPPTGAGVGGVGGGRDAAKIVLMTVDLLVTDLVPYFAVFSCVVMLVTKRLRRRDQVRQIDNTWKACNVDSSTAHQLHTSFIVVAIFHTVFLFPQLTYKTFNVVTDPQVTGLVQHTVAYRPAALTARAVCHLLLALLLSAKVAAFAVASPAFRRECVAVFTCFRRGNAGGGGPTDLSPADHVATGLPLLQPPPPPPPLIHSGENHRMPSPPCSLQPSPAPATNAPPPSGNKPDALSSAAILENGAPCIKIFSMTSV